MIEIIIKNNFSGILALGLFIHNAIITIMSNNKHQEHNVRSQNLVKNVIKILIFLGARHEHCIPACFWNLHAYRSCFLHFLPSSKELHRGCKWHIFKIQSYMIYKNMFSEFVKQFPPNRCPNCGC